MNMNIMNVKTGLIAVVSVVAVSCLMLILSNRAVAQMREGQSYQQTNKAPSSSQVSKTSQGTGGAAVATPITPEEAAKKYPAAKGKYPMGERDPHKASGLVTSPYPPHTEFDCSQVPHNGLVVDTRVNKVFVRP
jgi:hypothetical protein